MSNPGIGGQQEILRAALFAAKRHAAQKRKGAEGAPYVNHLLEVASLVADALEAPDENLIAAALLHDSIEDVGVSRDELIREFGLDVADLVAEVTDDKSLPKAERKRLQIVNAPLKSRRAGFIKVADKISNLRALLESPPPDWTIERRREYREWARRVVDGLQSPDAKLMAEFESVYQQLGKAST